jgi:hypothetical protein
MRAQEIESRRAAEIAGKNVADPPNADEISSKLRRFRARFVAASPL